MNLFFDATESSKAKSTLARLRLVGALAKVRKDILALGAGAGNIVQRLQLAKEALSLREQLGELDAPNDVESDNDPDREAILGVFRQLGRDYPDRSMSVAGNLAGSVVALIREAVGREVMPEELRQLVSMEDRRAAYREGQRSVDPVASAVVAMHDVIEAQADVLAAVVRDDIGAVDFIWGEEGKEPTASGKRKGAKGVAHILEARMRKDGLSLEEAAAVAEEVAKVVATGEITLTHHHQDVSQATITDGKYSAIMVKREGSNAWLLTGWEENKDSDATGKGDDKTSATHSGPTPARPGEGAEPSDINIAQSQDEGQPTDEGSASTIAAHGLALEVPAIEQQLIDDYNRTNHVFGGRDFNAELRSEAESLLNELVERNHTLDTPEQQALAKELIESYLQAQAEFAQWNARFSTSNPSWIVTGRSGRDMGKYNRANERHMDEYTRRVDQLQAQRDRIGETLYKMRPQEVQVEQALGSDLRGITQQAGHILGYLEEGKAALVAETRKWAAPKAHKLIERSLTVDRNRTLEHIRELENSKSVQDAGGLAKVFGPRSKAGKLVETLLSEPDS